MENMYEIYLDQAKLMHKDPKVWKDPLKSSVYAYKVSFLQQRRSQEFGLCNMKN